jgi:aryl-alcohol dehydrogenase-like predicted oxidoreductase
MYEKIAFGTASLGIEKYGINQNTNSENPSSTLNFILDQGIVNFDTAEIYGDSEIYLGKLKKNHSKIWVSTKISNLKSKNPKVSNEIYEKILNSRRRLCVEEIDLLYLHQNEPEIFLDKNIITALERLKNEGLLKELGVSLYSKEEILRASEVSVYDWIQIPISIFDCSLLHYAFECGFRKISARSVFIQGAVFSDDSQIIRLPQGKNFIDLRNKYLKLCKDYGVNFNQLLISPINSMNNVTQIILGTRSRLFWGKIDEHLKPLPTDLIEIVRNESKDIKAWTNPRGWSL